MKKLIFFLVLMFVYMVSFGQNINVTFTGTGAATRIDSVTATNLTTNQSVTLPGNETLVLTPHTGIPSISEIMNLGMVYPNPFSGKATLTTIVQNPQTVYLKVQNLVGQVVAQTKAFIQQGENEFDLSVNTAGIYMVSLTTEEGTASYQVICTETTESENSIQYLGSGSNNHNNHNNYNHPSQSGLKSSQTSFTLGYAKDDIILYRCSSGIYTTIVTDSPIASKNYDVEFVACTDPEGKNYSIVSIGTQTWTAENLAFLPSVSPWSSESDTSRSYGVYNYKGTNVSEAKATDNYTTYGVLYNWVAATNGASADLLNPNQVQGICPNEWHLPSDTEWTILTDYLGSSAGAMMKATGTTYWESPNEGATNASGFTAFPGGFCTASGSANLGYYSVFWTSSSNQLSKAWNRTLNNAKVVMSRSNDFRSRGVSVRCLLGQGAPGLAILTTAEITAKTKTSASSGGMITFNGGADITVRGVCWNSTGSPTINDRISNNGSGTGTFTSILTPLTSKTLYYVRAYATNSAGTAYGEQKQFLTPGVVGDGTFDYDGRTYAYKNIGTQTWMIENLAFLPSVSPSSAGSNTTPYYYVYGYEGTSLATVKATDNFASYGVLYNWEAAKTACPPGWHLPSDAEWTTLTDYLIKNQYGYGGSGTQIAKSIASTSGWTSFSTAGTVGNDQKSNNGSGFSAFPFGDRWSNGSFNGLGEAADFWSASMYDASDPSNRGVYYNDDVVNWWPYKKSDGMSVRCLKN